jgi:hypothetical protein
MWHLGWALTKRRLRRLQRFVGSVCIVCRELRMLRRRCENRKRKWVMRGLLGLVYSELSFCIVKRCECTIYYLPL